MYFRFVQIQVHRRIHDTAAQWFAGLLPNIGRAALARAMHMPIPKHMPKLVVYKRFTVGPQIRVFALRRKRLPVLGIDVYRIWSCACVRDG